MARAPKKCAIFCLDVGIGMQSAQPGKDTPLQLAVDVVTLLIQRKIFADSKDEVGLILFGTEDTNNQLADTGGYSNISVVFSPSPAEFKFLDYLSDQMTPGTSSADFLDVITVALDLLHTEKMKKKLSTCRVILLTNFVNEFNDDNIEGIVGGFTQEAMDVELVVISPGFGGVSVLSTPDDDDDDDDEPTTSTARKRRKVAHIASGGGGKPKSALQLRAERVVTDMFEQGVDGACYSFEHALRAVTGFEKKETNPSAWKCNLTLGAELAIPCVAYAKTKQAALKRNWKKCHAKTHKTSDVVKESYYFLDDDDKTQVAKEDIGKGYVYGTDLIPYGAEDEQQTKYQTEGKKLSLLGFTKSGNIPLHLRMDDQAHVVLPENEQCGRALYALATALDNLGLCGVACYVYRRGGSPKLVALVPRVKPDYSALVMFSLPFSEDIRPLSFPSLSGEKSQQPSASQEQALQQLIDSMDLSPPGEDDDERYLPSATLNPHFQRTFECLAFRSRQPRAPLPPTSDRIRNILAPAGCRPSAVDKVKREFPLEDGDGRKPAAKSTEIWKKASESKPSGDDVINDITTTTTIAAPEVSVVGSISPDSDFVAILMTSAGSSDVISDAFQQLQDKIEEFLSDSLAVRSLNKILVSLQVLIREAGKHNHVAKVNQFLVKLKKDLIAQSKKDLWKDLFVGNRINLIGAGDGVEPGASEEECREFWKLDEEVEEDWGDDDNEVDDLLDMLE